MRKGLRKAEGNVRRCNEALQRENRENARSANVTGPMKSMNLPIQTAITLEETHCTISSALPLFLAGWL